MEIETNLDLLSVKYDYKKGLFITADSVYVTIWFDKLKFLQPFTGVKLINIVVDRILRIDIKKTPTPPTGTGRYISFFIERGFEYDGASIPRLFWSLLGLTPGGKMTIPALVHDLQYGQGIKGIKCALYENCFEANEGTIWQYSRKDADKIMEILMRAVDARLTQQKTVYWAVRLGAYFNFNRDKNEEIVDGL